VVFGGFTHVGADPKIISGDRNRPKFASGFRHKVANVLINEGWLEFGGEKLDLTNED
jgi:hypothetical protein